MTQPPQPSDPRRSQGRHDLEQDPQTPAGRRPSPAIVAGALLLLVLLLALGAFFGVRAYLGGDSGAAPASVGELAGPPAHWQEARLPEK